MPNTYSQVYVHIVFAVKGRASLISKKWREELFRYMTGTLTNKHQKLIAIGGVEDHIHILIGLLPDQSISNLVKEIKVSSTLFVNRKRFVRGAFRWQEGFGVFSYSRSQIPSVAGYIENQEKHHRKKSFKREYLEILTKYEVEYDEKYLFDWID